MKLKLIAAAMLVSTSIASAADLPARTYTKAPVVSPAYNWSGFYAGVHGGYAWSNEVTAGIVGLGTLTETSSDFKGGFGGATIGYNWQAPGSQFVFGIEADAAGAGIQYSSGAFGAGASTKINALGSVTGRVGFAFDSALIYAKGGWAWANNEFTAFAGGASITESQFHSGWTIGGGVEWGFAPNWSAKAEYMYADFSNETYLNTVILGASLHTVKGGINYRF